MSARRIVCVAWGENKANIVKRTIEGDITDLIPSSFLQTHRRAKIVLDLSAAEALTRISRPWLVTSCEWDEAHSSGYRLVMQGDGKTHLEINRQGLQRQWIERIGSPFRIGL